ncbi:MAG: hypothetical protein JJ900_08910 [Rhodospirillales bacterium]|nr:hypothetical protein [Rhodospirillales bacterium]MBO6786959.1 hypothetical protein [Rhodospirillales bacterium]
MSDDNLEYTVLNVEDVPCEFPEGSPLARTLDLWRSWSGSNAAPKWDDVELYALPAIVLPQTLVVDVIDGGADFKYRFWGTKYTSHYGADETGLLLSTSLGPSFIEATRKQLNAVLASKAPCAFDVAIRAPRSGIVQTKLNLRLPIMDRPGEITKIMTATLFNETTINHREKLLEAFSDDTKRLASEKPLST